MSGSAASLREKLARVGQVKAQSADEDARRHLGLEPGARLEATVRHCDAHLAAFGAEERDDLAAADVAAWEKVRHHLHGDG